MVRTALKYFFLVISMAMIGVTVYTSIHSNLFEAWPRLAAEPWMSATLIDFYFNITILSSWVIYKEKRLTAAIFWIAAFVLLGSIATAFYVFLQLIKLKPGQGPEAVLLRNP